MHIGLEPDAPTILKGPTAALQIKSKCRPFFYNWDEARNRENVKGRPNYIKKGPARAPVENSEWMSPVPK